MYLECDGGDGRIRVELGPSQPRVTLGRLEGCEMRVQDPTVSRRHCEFTWSGGTVQAKDLGSSGGTWVDETRIEQKTLQPGDAIRCGALVVRLIDDEAPQRRRAPAEDDVDVPRRRRRPDDAPAEPAPGPVAGEVDEWGFSKAPPGGAALDEFGFSASPSGGVPLLDDGFGAADDGFGAVDDGFGPPDEDLGRSRGRGRGAAAEDDDFDPPPRRARGEGGGGASAQEASPDPARTQGTRPAAPAGFTLICVDTTGSERRVPLLRDTALVLGRAAGVDIQVPNPGISRRHCELRWSGDVVELRDLGSSGGTLIDGARVQSATLRGGDHFVCADLLCRIEAEAGAGGGAPAARPAQTNWQLIYEHAGHGEVRVDIPRGRELILGRNPDVDVRLEDRSVGRRHASVRWDGNELVVKDLDSTNGTFYEDKRVSRHVVKSGDRMRCGHYPIRFVAQTGGVATADDGWGDDWNDAEEMGPPSWHLVFTDADGRVCHETMDETFRVLAVGDDAACEISVAGRQLEPDHCEITWEEGVLIATDLQTERGTLVNGKRVDEHVLRNGDVIECGALRLHVVRGCDSSGRGASGGGEDVELWLRRFRGRDPGLCVVYGVDVWPDDDTDEPERQELTVWADGEAQLELDLGEERTTRTGSIRSGVLDALFSALSRSGFPETGGKPPERDESVIEVTAFQDDTQATVLLGRRALSRSEPYREASELLRAIAAELRV
ncbi:MAG: FHA domain-containing protein [Deltaproteobacteria bacterium]|nr:FHA domain-containing protein [Deltaproteobacteria bacterium]MCB9786207.1 FHA domain-containing protein [Deltaproteobacteria bacterium]